MKDKSQTNLIKTSTSTFYSLRLIMVLHCIRFTAIIYFIAAMLGQVASIIVLGQGILTNFALIQVPGLNFRIVVFIVLGSVFLITFTRHYLTRHLKLTRTETERYLESGCPQFIKAVGKIALYTGIFLFIPMNFLTVFEWIPRATPTQIPPFAVSSIGLIFFSTMMLEIYPLTKLRPFENG